MLRRVGLFFVLIPCVFLYVSALADTTVGDFETLNHRQRVSRMTELTNKTLDKIAAKDPVLALRIQEYFIIPPPNQKYGVGAMALEKQIDEYDSIDPAGYTIENAFAKVLSDYLAQNVVGAEPTTSPTTQATTQSS